MRAGDRRAEASRKPQFVAVAFADAAVATAAAQMYHSDGSVEARHLLTATTSSASPQPQSESAILVGNSHIQRASPLPSSLAAVAAAAATAAAAADKNASPRPPLYYERNRFLRPRMNSRRVRNRLVQKYGFVNISLVNVPKQHRKYFRQVANAKKFFDLQTFCAHFFF